MDTQGEDILQVDDGDGDDHNDGDQDEDVKDVDPVDAEIEDILQVEGEVLHPDQGLPAGIAVQVCFNIDRPFRSCVAVFQEGFHPAD